MLIVHWEVGGEILKSGVREKNLSILETILHFVSTECRSIVQFLDTVKNLYEFLNYIGKIFKKAKNRD